MDKVIDLNSFLDYLSILGKMYDVVRIVDPLKKSAKLIVDNCLEDVEETCYVLWKQNKICQNCIAIRSYYENKSFFKIEFNGSSLFMLTTVPITTNKGTYVVEFMKDVTDLFIIGSININNISDTYEKINKLNDLFVKDELTGVYNRRFVNERLEVEILNAYSNKQPLSIILSDLDGFKNINDAYGHVIGDKVLIEFTNIVNKNIRTNIDWIARYGGDEFLICLVNVERKRAYQIGERIRNDVANSKIAFENKEIKFRASFGVASIRDDLLLTADELIKLADEKLYKAKRMGKNVIIM